MEELGAMWRSWKPCGGVGSHEEELEAMRRSWKPCGGVGSHVEESKSKQGLI